MVKHTDPVKDEEEKQEEMKAKAYLLFSLNQLKDHFYHFITVCRSSFIILYYYMSQAEDTSVQIYVRYPSYESFPGLNLMI